MYAFTYLVDLYLNAADISPNVGRGGVCVVKALKYIIDVFPT